MKESMLDPFGGETSCLWLHFFQIASCKINKGVSVSFWTDPWSSGVPKDTYPQLFSFIRKKSCSINQFIIWDDYRSFFLPLSQIASDQLAALKADVQGLNMDLVSDDIWSYSWGSNTFSSHKVYISIQGSHPASPFPNGNGTQVLLLSFSRRQTEH
jgi:hypothetical protein